MMAETVADFLIERLMEWGVSRIYGYPALEETLAASGILLVTERSRQDGKRQQVGHFRS
jgi:hypothetical protein